MHILCFRLKRTRSRDYINTKVYCFEIAKSLSRVLSSFAIRCLYQLRLYYSLVYTRWRRILEGRILSPRHKLSMVKVSEHVLKYSRQVGSTRFVPTQIQRGPIRANLPSTTPKRCQRDAYSRSKNFYLIKMRQRVCVFGSLKEGTF